MSDHLLTRPNDSYWPRRSSNCAAATACGRALDLIRRIPRGRRGRLAWFDLLAPVAVFHAVGAGSSSVRVCGDDLIRPVTDAQNRRGNVRLRGDKRPSARENGTTSRASDFRSARSPAAKSRNILSTLLLVSTVPCREAISRYVAP